MFAVFGGTGRIGGATIRALREAGAPVRAIVRDGHRAGQLEALGCEIDVADLRDPAAIAAAIEGATAVQVFVPVAPQPPDAVTEMNGAVDAIADALRASPPPTVLAISDYGAEVDGPTGITRTFHHLEARLRDLPSAVTFLRSAEHMQNWARQAPAAVETGTLASLHQPLTKRFPTVSAPDVGVVAAALLLDDGAAPRVINVEGPRRYTALDVAAALGELTGREVVARELPREQWSMALERGGVGASYAALVTELFDAHNAGLIGAEDGWEIRQGTTELRDVLASLVGR